MIQSFAEDYVARLAELHQEKVNSCRACLLYSVILFVLAFFNAILDLSFIHVVSSLTLLGFGIYYYSEFQEHLKKSQEINAHYKTQKMWLGYSHPAFVCQEAYNRFCPEIDKKIKENAMTSGYDDRDLVEHFYRQEMYSSKIFRQ